MRPQMTTAPSSPTKGIRTVLVAMIQEIGYTTAN